MHRTNVTPTDAVDWGLRFALFITDLPPSVLSYGVMIFPTAMGHFAFLALLTTGGVLTCLLRGWTRPRRPGLHSDGRSTNITTIVVAESSQRQGPNYYRRRLIARYRT